MTTPAPVTGWWCEDCQQVVDDPVAVYECGTCGDRSDERRCENCNRFKGRAEADGCPDCFAEVEEAEVISDHDGQMIRAEDYDPEGLALAERTEIAQAEAEARRKNEAEARRAAQLADSRQTTWGSLAPGARIVVNEPDTLGGERLPTVARVTPADDGGVVVAVSRYGSIEIDRHADDEPVRIATTQGEPEPLGVYTLTDDPIRGASSPSPGLVVEYGHGTRSLALVPMLLLRTGGSNMTHTIGLWYDRALAEHALDILDQAARRLAAALGTPLDPQQGAKKVTVEETTWINAWGFPKETEIRVGPDAWHPEYDAIVDLRVDRSSVVLADPHALAYAVAQARALLPTLTAVPKTTPAT